MLTDKDVAKRGQGLAERLDSLWVRLYLFPIRAFGASLLLGMKA